MTTPTPQRPHSGKGLRHKLRFWALAVVVCVLAALVVLGIRALVESVGESRQTRYEPVDVPPPEVSPRHRREQQELEERNKALEEKAAP